MKPRIVSVIARKEFLDVLRDRRTLVFMVLLPLAVMPALLIGFSKFAKKQLKEKESRELTVAVDGLGGNLLRSMANRWRSDHLARLIGVADELGVFDFASMEGFDGLERLTRRVETLQDQDSLQDAALLAYVRAYQDLDPDDKQLLADAGAVLSVPRRLRFIPFDEVDPGGGTLAPGVEIPEDLPGEVGSERVALAIQNKTLHAAVHVPVDLLDRLEQAALTASVHVVHDSSISLSKEARDRLAAFLDAIGRHEVQLRLRDANLSPAFVEPLEVADADVASSSRRIQGMIGGFLPYMILLFSYMGAFYPSLDLTAGEKERFTLETLLLAPVSRLEIAAGKFCVVFVAAIVAAVLSTASMVLTLGYGVLPEGTAAAFDLQFEPLALALTASLLLPVAALFSAMLLGVALYARSFKEAQSYTVPLQFIIIVPAIMALLPNMETELRWAWVPLVNVSLLMKELLKGNYLWTFYGITLGSILVLTAAALWGASLLFRRESVLLRS